MWKEHQNDPDKAHYVRMAMEFWDGQFSEVSEMIYMRPFMKSWLLSQIREKNLKGPEILTHFVDHVGTREDLYDKKLIPWLPGPLGLPFGEKTSRAPVGEHIEAERQRLEDLEKSRQSQTSTTIQGPEEIPLQIRSKIADELTRQGFKHTDENYWKVYNKYKDQF
jgi:hypothetical protein